MSETATTPTPQERYDLNIKAYDLVAQDAFNDKKLNVVLLSTIPAMVMGYGIEKESIDYAAQFYPAVPNPARSQAIEASIADFDKLNAVTSDSLLSQNADGHFSYVPVAQKKAEVKQNLTSAMAQPATVPSENAVLLGKSLAFSPVAVLFSVTLGMAIVAKRLKNKRRKFCDTMSEVLCVDYYDGVTDTARKINNFAKENDMPAFNPPKPKKILGLF